MINPNNQRTKLIIMKFGSGDAIKQHRPKVDV